MDEQATEALRRKISHAVKDMDEQALEELNEYIRFIEQERINKDIK